MPGGASAFDELVAVMRRLRDREHGCPWDLEQDHMSLRGHLVEEAYEALAAIEERDDASLADELGDLLLQIVFHARIASERGAFDVDDVARGIVTKLERRHPHIFGDTEVADADEVTVNWDAIKREEKAGRSALAGVPTGLPSLMRAQKISRKAAGTGFDWETVEEVWDKVHEEIEELRELPPGAPEAEGEVGDLLFTVVNVARKLGIDSEMALRHTCDKFERRFTRMERAAGTVGLALEDLETGDMEELWAESKRLEREGGEKSRGGGDA